MYIVIIKKYFKKIYKKEVKKSKICFFIQNKF